MKIAVLSSGLGRVQRGNETWAWRLAEGLSGKASGGGEGIDAIWLCGGCPLNGVSSRLNYRRIPCLSRELSWLRWMPFQRRYLIEQRTFVMGIKRWLIRSGVDIVHVADPQVAWLLREAFRRGGPEVIYKDGLLLGPDWNWRFKHVQVLAPQYLEAAEQREVDVSGWRVIPHFVDGMKFRPWDMLDGLDGRSGGGRTANPAGRLELRRTAPGGVLPEDAYLVLAVGDVSGGSSKRLDWIVEEVASVVGDKAPHLVVAGNAELADRKRFEAFARGRLGDRFHFRPRLDPELMPRLYAAVDVMAHAALREPFGLVLIEAMACGIPVVGHDYPVTRWIIGEGGCVVDMECRGQLCDVLTRWRDDIGLRDERGGAARRRAMEYFAPETLLPAYREWYASIVGK